MRRFETVFLDMDGVLANFIAGAYAANGRMYVPEEYPRGCWEIADVWGIPVEEFWEKIDEVPAFWERLEPYKWMKDVVDIAHEAGEEVKILTSPSKSPSCWSGKRRWCMEHLPDLELILCKSKRLLASPNRLLIDDGDHNVGPWKIAGGRAILFPQPWNDNYDLRHDPISHVITSLVRSR